MNHSSYINENDAPLETLALADPDLARRVKVRLDKAGYDLKGEAVSVLAGDVVYGLSIESALGRALADGYLALIIGGADRKAIDCYSRALQAAIKEGPTFGRILAASLPPVLLHPDSRLFDRFMAAVNRMKARWLYALTAEPMEILGELVTGRAPDAGLAYLDLLLAVFDHDLTYNQYRRFTAEFPRAVLSFTPGQRAWKTVQLERVVRRDFDLACLFLTSLTRELAFLAPADLERFVSEGLDRHQKDANRGKKFLTLESRTAIETCDRLRTTAIFPEMQQKISCYLHARTGRAIPVKPLSGLPAAFFSNSSDVSACSDGKTIFLADTIDRHSRRKENSDLYKALAWIEAGLFEFGTFDFDLQKALECAGLPPQQNGPDEEGRTDMERLFDCFPHPGLAADLFSIFEYGRVRTLLEERYPEGARRFYGLVRHEAAPGPGENRMQTLHASIALGRELAREKGAGMRTVETVARIFNHHAAGRPFPEASAQALFSVFEGLRPGFFMQGEYKPMTPALGLCLRPALFARAWGEHDRLAARVQQAVAKEGYKAYKSDILRRMREQGGLLYTEDIQQIVARTPQAHEPVPESGAGPGLPGIDLSDLHDALAANGPAPDPAGGPVYRYREWDHAIGDYLTDHVLVRERRFDPPDSGFYQSALARHRGLVKKIRYAFELLKPEGMTVLRKWREGEDFDYRQLIDFVIDKKAGKTPSERIYIKRLKKVRDVAVLLLLDISRSTSGTVAGSDTATVLSVEKEATVLFCEALAVVGDTFAIAGFSGTGRLGVDYFPIKEFDCPMTDTVRRAIGGLSPQRNTRMGAAIRHATAQLKAAAAASKLLIIVTDGFPNDLDYKRERAIEDTRRALLEARAGGIAVHTITVNIAGDGVLDDLYGKVRHSVISNVRELPDKLLRIYGRLTG